jgi:hypothetical protein
MKHCCGTNDRLLQAARFAFLAKIFATIHFAIQGLQARGVRFCHFIAEDSQMHERRQASLAFAPVLAGSERPQDPERGGRFVRAPAIDRHPDISFTESGHRRPNDTRNLK